MNEAAALAGSIEDAESKPATEDPRGYAVMTQVPGVSGNEWVIQGKVPIIREPKPKPEDDPDGA